MYSIPKSKPKPRNNSVQPPNRKPGLPKANAQGNKPKIMTLNDIKRREEAEKPTRNPMELNARRMANGVPPEMFKPVGTKLYSDLEQGPPIKKNGPIRIGKSIGPMKWNCNLCKFANDKDLKVCQRCDSEKGETKQKQQPVHLRKPGSRIY